MVKYAFEPFGDISGVMAGKPFKIFPEGTFYRDDRVLVITPDRLREMETNFKSNLPRFRVPINENHGGVGKIGTVQDVEYRPGEGLYATKYEFTDEGKKLIEQQRYDAVSGEVYWTLNGAKYQDPTTGIEHDNVLTGVAVTDTPFFGHDEVALFSAKTPQQETAKGNSMPEEFDAKLKELQDDFDAKLKANNEAVKAQKEAFDAQLKSQQEAFEAEKKRADEFAQKLAVERKTREIAELTDEAETFTHLSLNSTEYAEKFYDLRQINPDLYKWVKDKFELFDTQLTQSELFTQKTNVGAEVAGQETLVTVTEKILKDEFDGDRSHYKDAMLAAGDRRPDLIPAEDRVRKVRNTGRK